jgi:hypothetical protein
VRYEGKAHERPGYTESMAGVHSSISAQVAETLLFAFGRAGLIA